MPSVLTHYYFANRVMCELGDGKNTIKPEREAFFWGAQGADILLAYRRKSSFEGDLWAFSPDNFKYAENAPRFFDLCAEYLRKNNNSEPMRSYILGLLCHFLLERSAQPFINSAAKTFEKKYPKKQSDFPWRSQIKTCLDIIVLRYETGKLPTDISLKIAAPKNAALWQSIGEFWQFIFEKMRLSPIGSSDAARIAPCYRRQLGKRNNRFMIKKPVIEAWEKLANKGCGYSVTLMGISEGDIDYANISRREWTDTAQNKYNHSFLDIYDRTAAAAPAVIKQFMLCVKKKKTTDEIF